MTLLLVHSINMSLYDNIILEFIVRTRQIQLFRVVFVMTRLSIAFTEAHSCKYDIVLECNRRECGKLLLL